MLRQVAFFRREGLMLWWIALAAAGAASFPIQDPTVNSRRASPIARDLRYREWLLKDLEKNGKKTPEQQQLAWRQIREDYQHIQIVSNELAEQRVSGEALNAQRVEKSAGEIYKHAVRLRANLMLPSEEAVAKDKKAQSDLQMSTMLSALSGLIKRFVRNPIFADD